MYLSIPHSPFAPRYSPPWFGVCQVQPWSRIVRYCSGRTRTSCKYWSQRKPKYQKRHTGLLPSIEHALTPPIRILANENLWRLQLRLHADTRPRPILVRTGTYPISWHKHTRRWCRFSSPEYVRLLCQPAAYTFHLPIRLSRTKVVRRRVHEKC